MRRRGGGSQRSLRRVGPGTRSVCGGGARVAQIDETVRTVFFFFQAEDGIRDVAVTGVQTCALPISAESDFHFKTGSSPLAIALNVKPQSPSSKGNNTWASGSPKRTLTSKTLGP